MNPKGIWKWYLNLLPGILNMTMTLSIITTTEIFHLYPGSLNLFKLAKERNVFKLT